MKKGWVKADIFYLDKTNELAKKTALNIKNKLHTHTVTNGIEGRNNAGCSLNIVQTISFGHRPNH